MLQILYTVENQWDHVRIVRESGLKKKYKYDIIWNTETNFDHWVRPISGTSLSIRLRGQINSHYRLPSVDDHYMIAIVILVRKRLVYYNLQRERTQNASWKSVLITIRSRITGGRVAKRRSVCRVGLRVPSFPHLGG